MTDTLGELKDRREEKLQGFEKQRTTNQTYLQECEYLRMEKEYEVWKNQNCLSGE